MTRSVSAVDVPAKEAAPSTRPLVVGHRALSLLAVALFIYLLCTGDKLLSPIARLSTSNYRVDVLRDISLQSTVHLSRSVGLLANYSAAESHTHALYYTRKSDVGVEQFIVLAAKGVSGGMSLYNLQTNELVWSNEVGRVTLLSSFSIHNHSATTPSFYFLAWSKAVHKLYLFGINSDAPGTANDQSMVTEIDIVELLSIHVTNICAGVDNSKVKVFVTSGAGKCYLYEWTSTTSSTSLDKSQKLKLLQTTTIPLFPSEKVGNCAVLHRFRQPQIIISTTFGNVFMIHLSRLTSISSNTSSIPHYIEGILHTSDLTSNTLDFNLPLSHTIMRRQQLTATGIFNSLVRTDHSSKITSMSHFSYPIHLIDNLHNSTNCSIDILVLYLQSSIKWHRSATRNDQMKSLGRFVMLYRPSCYNTVNDKLFIASETSSSFTSTLISELTVYGFMPQWRFLTAFTLPTVHEKVQSLHFNTYGDSESLLQQQWTMTMKTIWPDDDHDIDNVKKVSSKFILLDADNLIFKHLSLLSNLTIHLSTTSSLVNDTLLTNDTLQNYLQSEQRELAEYICSTTRCGNHGVCASSPLTNLQKSSTCQCFDGYTGATCTEMSCTHVDNCGANATKPRGKCIGPEQCSCYHPFTGPSCSYIASPSFAASLILVPSQSLSNHTAKDNDDPEVYIHPQRSRTDSVVLGTTKSRFDSSGLHVWQLDDSVVNSTRAVGREIWYEPFPMGTGANSVDVIYNVNVTSNDSRVISEFKADLVVASVRGNINGFGIWAVDPNAITYNIQQTSIDSIADVKPVLLPISSISYSTELTAQHSALDPTLLGPQPSTLLPFTLTSDDYTFNLNHSIVQLSSSKLLVYGSCVSGTARNITVNSDGSVYITTKTGFIHHFTLSLAFTSQSSSTPVDKLNDDIQSVYISRGLHIHVHEKASLAIGFKTQLENCFVDDEFQTIFIGEEAVGVWAYPLTHSTFTNRNGIVDCDPMHVPPLQQFEDNANGRFIYPLAVALNNNSGHCSVMKEGQLRRAVLLDSTYIVNPDGHLVSDVEGLSIYRTSSNNGTGAGYLIVSIQGANAYAIYERQYPWQYLTTIHIVSSIQSGMDEVTETDSLVASSNAIGQFSKGVLVLHDDVTTIPNVNGTYQALDIATFKVVDWYKIAQAVDNATDGLVKLY